MTGRGRILKSAKHGRRFSQVSTSSLADLDALLELISVRAGLDQVLLYFGSFNWRFQVVSSGTVVLLV